MRPTPSLAGRMRRLRLTTKMAGAGYYKGTGSGAMGWHTKHGGYIIDPNKVRTYKVPENLRSFKLTPYVTKKVDPPRGQYEILPDGKVPSNTSGERYLWQWQQEGGTI